MKHNMASISKLGALFLGMSVAHLSNPAHAQWNDSRGSCRDTDFSLRQNYHGRNRIDLTRYTNACQPTSITLWASSEHGFGRAQLLADNQSVSQMQTLQSGLGSYVFGVDFASSRRARNLTLELVGNFYVDRIQIHYAGNTFNPRPDPISPPGFGQREYLGVSDLVGRSVGDFRISLLRSRNSYRYLVLRAVDDAYRVSSLDVRFSNGQLFRVGEFIIAENNEHQIDLGNDRGSDIQEIFIRGSQAILWGTRARIEVYGIR